MKRSVLSKAFAALAVFVVAALPLVAAGAPKPGRRRLCARRGWGLNSYCSAPQVIALVEDANTVRFIPTCRQTSGTPEPRKICAMARALGWRTRLAVAAGIAATLVLGPGLANIPTSEAATGKVNTAWLPYWDMSDAYNAVIRNADLFSTASPFWYVAGSCTSITGHTGAGNTYIINGLHARGIKVVPTITSAMSPAAAIACFGNATSRKAHVARVVNVAKSRAYDGIDFNYEQLALTTSPATAVKVRAAYSAFIKDVCAGLRAARKQCVVTVMPRTDDSYSVWRSKLIPGVYDYAVLGAAATKLRVMAYDQHAPNTTAGPIGGYPWTVAVAKYTRSKVSPGKVEMGTPLYGRNWASGTATTVSAPQATALAARYGAWVRYDATQKAPWFTYVASGVRHTVWYSNSTSVRDRYRLARAYGFSGVALWAPGQEDSATWRVLRAG